MQKLNEFLTSPCKKILIGNSLGDLDSLIKLYARNEKKSFSNFEKETIIDLAKSIFFYLNSDYEYIDNEIANILFYKFLNSKRDKVNPIYNLIPDKSFSLKTAEVCLKSINEIRKGKINPDGRDEKIDKLIKDYEDYLLSNNKIDAILLINKALESLKTISKEKLENILGCHKEYTFALLKNSLIKQLTYTESNFLNNVLNKLNKELIVLEAFEPNEKINVKSYKTYGFYQEVINAIKIIDENRLPIQDTAIVVSDNTYNNSLKAYLDNYKIPYYFECEESITCFALYGLISSIIEFLTTHYSIASLYDIYRSKCIDEKFTNISNIKDLKAVKEQIELVSSTWNDSQREFIIDLLNIDEYSSISHLYKNILAFIDKYVPNDVDPLVKSKLIEKANLFLLLDDIDNLDAYKTIKTILDSLTIDINRYPQPRLSIYKLSSINYLNKKHVFLLGLSSSQLNIHEIESPLISDNKLKKMIDYENYYVDLASEENNRFNAKLEKLIQRNKCENIYMSYSYYDSSEFRNLTESIFYLNHLTNDPIIPNLSVGVKFNSVNSDSPILANNDKFDELKKETSLTPTLLDNIYTCALKYFYQNYFEDLSFNEYEHKWLEANESGTFIHRILQEYYSMHNNKDVDEGSFSLIFNKIKQEEIKKHPFDNERIIEKFSKRYEKILFRYINLNSKDGFKVLCCEKRFNNVEFTLNEKPYIFHGQIDRVDYKVEDSKVLINIYDYKSGHKKTLAKSGLTQAFIYTKAMKHLISLDTFKEQFNKNSEFIFTFHYIYLEEDDMDSLMSDKKIDECIKANEEQLRLFDSLENNITSYLKIYKPKLVTENDFTHSVCTYCNYKKYCALKRNVSFNKSR